MMKSMTSVLILCDDHRNYANTLLDHIDAFLNLSGHKVYKYNPRDWSFHGLLDLQEFDVVVIHYSLSIVSDHLISPALRQKIHEFQGLKIQYIQDDCRQVDQYTSMMRYLGVNILFTPYAPEKISLIYDEKRLPGVVKRTALTGYVPERYKNMETLPLKDRPIDVGYRGRTLPYWLGTLSQEKTWIGQNFLKHAKQYGLRCNIAWNENDRIYGKQWDLFISSCKAMLGTESGASITDFDGSIEIKVKEYLAVHPKANFEEVYKHVLSPYEGNLVLNTISPRMFECAAHRTAMILFPGEYSKLLQPWVHYIPLQKDFSNLEDVIAKLQDIDFLTELAERTYVDLIESGKYSYHEMIKEFDEVVECYLRIMPRGARPKVRFWLARVEIATVYLLKLILRPLLRFWYIYLKK
jgi:hypothetical protein